MKEFPYMPFFARDWLASRSVRLMTPAERGAYIDLICHAWLSPEPGVLIADELPALSGLGPDEFLKSKPALARAFDLVSRPGYWIQKRCVAEAAKAKMRSRRLSAAGTKGNEVKRQQVNTPRVRQAYATRTQPQIQTSDSDSYTQESRPRKSAFRGGSPEAEKMLDDIEAYERENKIGEFAETDNK